MQSVEIIKYIEKLAPLGFAEAWDKSGTQVAAHAKEIKKVSVMLDPTLENIKTAIEHGADFILAHHPLNMTAVFPDTLNPYHAILSLLLKNDICLYSAHTSLDANPRGTVRWLAEALELTEVQILEVTGSDAQGDYGFGFYGNLPAEQSYENFVKKMSQVAESSAWRSCGPELANVRTVACLPGSGSSAIAEAKAAGADVFITGDMRYHQALDAEIKVIDLGHFKLEEIMMRKFAEQMQKDLPAITVDFISGTDPFSFSVHNSMTANV